MDYQFYTVEEFVLDESFQSFVLKQNDESLLFWLDWIKQNPTKKKITDEASLIIRAISSGKSPLLENEFSEELGKIKTIIADSKIIEMKPTSNNVWKWISGVAASLLILVTVGFFQFGSLKETKVFWVEKTTQKGQKLLIKLADGSTVNLNSGSSLRYKEGLQGDTREVYLDGEGFFDVTKNAERPFIVHTGLLKTTVLGTSFNILAYSELDIVEIALVTGKVIVTDAINREIKLTPNQLAKYNKHANDGFEKATFNYNEVVGWKEGILLFKDTSLEQVFNELEMWYGVSINVENGINLKGKYNGSFQNEKLENILDAYSVIEGYEYAIEENTVSIKNKIME